MTPTVVLILTMKHQSRMQIEVSAKLMTSVMVVRGTGVSMTPAREHTAPLATSAHT